MNDDLPFYNQPNGRATHIGEIIGVIAGILMVLVFGYVIYRDFIAPTPNFTAIEATDLKIKGNKNSKIFHLQSCPNYNDIADHNIVWFKTVEDARALGYRRARNC